MNPIHFSTYGCNAYFSLKRNKTIFYCIIIFISINFILNTCIKSNISHIYISTPFCESLTSRKIRSISAIKNEDIFRTVCAHVGSEVKARSFRLNSSRIDENHPLVRKAKALGRTPFGSPTLSDQALMRFPSLKMGPGESSRSHTADEYIKVPEIEEAIGLYIDLLDGLQI